MHKVTSSFILSIFTLVIFITYTDAHALAMQNQNKEVAPDSNYVTVNDTCIFYREAGDGEVTLLLIHGWPLSSQLYQKNIPALADAYHVIVPDLRGFGNSEMTGTPSEIRVEDYANDILALMDELGIEQAMIGGMSMGGPIVFSMYQQAPDRFTGMLLIDTIAAPAPPYEKQLWLGWAKYIEKKGVGVIPKGAMDEMLTAKARMNKKDLVNTVTSIMKNASKEGAIGGAYALANRPDFRPLLSEINVPTLIIVGMQDTIYPYGISKNMNKKIQNSTLEIIDNGSHATIIEDAEQANDAILSWIGSM